MVLTHEMSWDIDGRIVRLLIYRNDGHLDSGVHFGALKPGIKGFFDFVVK